MSSFDMNEGHEWKHFWNNENSISVGFERKRNGLLPKWSVRLSLFLFTVVIIRNWNRLPKITTRDLTHCYFIVCKTQRLLLMLWFQKPNFHREIQLNNTIELNQSSNVPDKGIRYNTIVRRQRLADNRIYTIEDKRVQLLKPDIFIQQQKLYV